MTSFDNFAARFDSVPAEIARRLGRIDRWAGQSDLYRQQLPRLLETLQYRAWIDSVEASSAIEGVTAPHARAEAVIANPDETPRNRSEAEIRGYANALTYAFEIARSSEPISIGTILHLHRLLYEPAGVQGTGQFKTADNLVVERGTSGTRQVRFIPVSAIATPTMIENLLGMYEEVSRRKTHHSLIMIAAFTLDFTVIHPFADGNGRLSRLLTNLLLDRAGYDVGRYVSIERIVEQSKERYYATLLASTKEWHESTQDVWPWTSYFVETIESAYSLFINYAEEERSMGSKQDRVRRHLQDHANKSFAMSDLRQALPGISDATMRVVLRELRDKGLVTSTTGRGAQWSWAQK